MKDNTNQEWNTFLNSSDYTYVNMYVNYALQFTICNKNIQLCSIVTYVDQIFEYISHAIVSDVDI